MGTSRVLVRSKYNLFFAKHYYTTKMSLEAHKSRLLGIVIIFGITLIVSAFNYYFTGSQNSWGVGWGT